jgi:hypothetical protein
MKIGRQVRKARDVLLERSEAEGTAGLSISDSTISADQLKVTSQHLSRIQLDQATPSVETLLKLS